MHTMKIGIDASGGDYGLIATVPGALLAARKHRLHEVVLYGKTESILAIAPKRRPKNLMLVDCLHPNEEMRRALTDLKNSWLQTIVSGIDSSRLSAAIKPHLLRNVPRAGLITSFPTAKGLGYFLDIGATSEEEDPAVFFGWAIAGRRFLIDKIGIPEPTFGLLSNAKEKAATAGLKAINDELQRLPGYQGYIEADEFLKGKVDLWLCNGFHGNLVLKWSEQFASNILREAVFAVWDSGAKEQLVKLAKQRYSYEAYLISPLVGLAVKGQLFRFHGRADDKQIAQAIGFAAKAIKGYKS